MSSEPDTTGVARVAVTFFGALSTMALTVADAISLPVYVPENSIKEP
jgi:hypothetical protein